LAWLFSHDADLWAPTAEQQAQRWLDGPIGQRAEEDHANRSRLRAYRAMFDGLPVARPAEPDSRAAEVGARLFGGARKGAGA
jgi:hypothetical protein